MSAVLALPELEGVELDRDVCPGDLIDLVTTSIRLAYATDGRVNLPAEIVEWLLQEARRAP
jgi:hypothetical protein